jgi:hypothetical protein
MSTNEFVGKFAGSDEIAEAVVLDFKTAAGSDVLEVVFKSGKKRVYTLKTLNIIATDEVSDATAISQKKLLAAVKETLDILGEYDISVGEIDMFQKQLGSNLENSFNRATSFMWFKDKEEFVPNFNPMYDVSFLMAQKYLTENEPK